MLSLRSKVVRRKYVFRVLVHEYQLIFNLQQELASNCFKTALEHPEQMFARAVFALEGLYF